MFQKGDKIFVTSYSKTFGRDQHTGHVVTGNVSMRLWEGIGRCDGTALPEAEPHLYVYLNESDDSYWLPVCDLRAAHG